MMTKNQSLVHAAWRRVGSGGAARVKAAFTLVEMMVAVALLVVILLAVGQIFRSTSTAVEVGQSTMEMMSGVRTVEAQLSHDLHHLDTNGYLIIRSQALTLDPAPNSQGLTTAVPINCDQLAFMARGTFRNMTGSYGQGGSGTQGTFTDHLQSNAAAIWYGQLVSFVPTPSGSGGAYQNTAVSLGAVPPFVNPNGASILGPNNAIVAAPQSFILGRHQFLLSAQNSTNPPLVMDGIADQAYPNIGYTTPSVQPSVNHNVQANLTSSRVDAAAITPEQVSQELMAAVNFYPPASILAAENYVSNIYCYRFATVTSPYATPLGLVNAYYRMTPQLLPGVFSFQVQWTPRVEPVIATAAGTFPEIAWFGLANPAYAPNPAIPGYPPDPPVDQNAGGTYEAVFYPGNKAQWPAALKITYSVIDPTGVLTGGRTFTQIVDLPH